MLDAPRTSAVLAAAVGTALRGADTSAHAPVVRRLDPLQHHVWDATLASFPETSVFHSSAWLRTLRAAYPFAPCCFINEDATDGSSLLLCLEVDSWLTGRRGISLPFTDECEPLCRDAGTFCQLFEHAVAYGRSRKWRYLEIRGGSCFLSEAPASLSFYGHRLSLAADEATLFARCESATRRAVRKAEQSELTVEFSSQRDAVIEFHRLLCKTRRRHGLPPQPLRFFEILQQQALATNHGTVVLARHNGVAIAAAVFLQFGKRVVYKYGASDESYQHLRGNNLVMWTAIKHYAARGCETLDFGRTSLANEGLRKFKLGWGTQEYPIEYFKYDFQRGAFIADSDRSSGWHSRIFRALPSPISRLLGTALYKHIA